MLFFINNQYYIVLRFYRENKDEQVNSQYFKKCVLSARKANLRKNSTDVNTMNITDMASFNVWLPWLASIWLATIVIIMVYKRVRHM